MSEVFKLSSTERVQLALNGLNVEVRHYPEGVRTALDAAAAIGCSVAAIAKSLIFKDDAGQAVLVVASGINQVDTSKVGTFLNSKLDKADAAFVRERTGFAIGGVPPVGHLNPSRVVLDRDLLELEEIWAAAGTPAAVFNLKPQDLPGLTGGHFIDLRKDD